MTKSKEDQGASLQKTALDQLAAKLRTALRRETTNIIEIGNLLIKIREHLGHGEWLPWLEKNFDLSLRTAQRYIHPAEYVADKSDTVAHFGNLSPSVLYGLMAGHYNEQGEAAILVATHDRRVDQDAAWAICEKLAPPDDDDAEDADDDDSDSGGEDGGEDDAEKDPEIKAILDGSPPAVPPPAPIPPPPDFALRDFDQAIATLKRLMTKSSAQFISSIHSGDDLESVACFIHAVTKTKAAAATA